MSQTVDRSTNHGVTSADATTSATLHGAHDRSTVHGVTVAEATSNAVTNTHTADE